MEDVRKDPYSLPASFQWADLNLDNDEEVQRKSLTGKHGVGQGMWRWAVATALTSAAPRAGEGAVYAAARELRGGRRQHVPLRLLARLFALGALSARLQARVARGRARDPGEE